MVTGADLQLARPAFTDVLHTTRSPISRATPHGRRGVEPQCISLHIYHHRSGPVRDSGLMPISSRCPRPALRHISWGILCRQARHERVHLPRRRFDDGPRLSGVSRGPRLTFRAGLPTHGVAAQLYHISFMRRCKSRFRGLVCKSLHYTRSVPPRNTL